MEAKDSGVPTVWAGLGQCKSRLGEGWGSSKIENTFKVWEESYK